MTPQITTVHVPILVAPILEALIEPFRNLPDNAAPHWIVDCTLGGGGHTSSFLEALGSDPKLARHKVLAIDQDQNAIDRAQIRFSKEIGEGRLELAHARFSEAREVLGERPVLGLMADLGFSSDQLEDPSRGLSFQTEGPLDMRLDPSRGISARDFLIRTPEQELRRVLSEYGEERFANRIASSIVERRRKEGVPLTTKGFVDWVVKAIPAGARHGRIHAATRTFQALRIAVNGELEELDTLLERVILSLQPGGRVAILSFHSLEDRKVKHAFRQNDAFRILTKKPVEADEEEIRGNPRARSAKLRIAERVS